MSRIVAAAPVRKVVVASHYGGHNRERLERIFEPALVVHVTDNDRQRVLFELNDAQVAILSGLPSLEMLDKPQLRWIHCGQSGLDRCASSRFLQSGISITSAAGRSSPALAEHALFFMLGHAYRAPDLFRAQRRRTWGYKEMPALRSLAGCRVLVIGLGHTARALVPRLLALDMGVTVFRRRAEPETEFDVPVFSLEAGDSLNDRLADADFVVLAASLNNSSFRMIGGDQFRAMKPGSCLVNMARAELVDKAAMLSALRSGRLGGAGVDVTEPEPLPPWDPLWRCRNVIVTPHSTPRVEDRDGREIDIIADNWRRFQSGSPLLNLLTERDAFDHSTKPRYSMLQRRAWRIWNAFMKPTAVYR